MTALLSKALILARSHVNRLLRPPASVAAASRSHADVTRFEIPQMAPAFAPSTRDDLLRAYWRSHPRFGFLKKAPPEALMIDIGAGTGGLAFWRQYLEPDRHDIRLFGVDLQAPLTRVMYEQFAVTDLDKEFPFADTAFDAAVASHILEHVKDPAALLRAISARLRPDGQLYVEIPSPASTALPSATEYRNHGWPMMISNFYDDATHRQTFALADLLRMGEAADLACIESGAISCAYVEDALVARGIEWRDEELLLYGYWSKTRWAQYAVFRKDESRSIRNMTTLTEKSVPLTESDLPPMPGMVGDLRGGRSIRDGYTRGWGLEFGGLMEKVAKDPLYREASRLAHGRSLVSEARRMNLFLLLRFYLPKLARGNIIEFGAYRGGNAAFLARVAQATAPHVQVFALDSFTGMPETDHAIDAHRRGDFGDALVDEVRAFAADNKLDNLHLVPGLFEETAARVIEEHGPFALAHVDCDIHSAVACAYETVRNALVPGAYIVFDDATTSSCIGATEVVEQLVVRRDGLSSEQIYPHFVFRAPS